MTIDRWILVIAWLLSLSGMAFAIPRGKFRHAVILFFFTQMITWSLSLIFVQAGMVTNPVREFNVATRANFTFNFLMYPTISTLFGVYYPDQASKWGQFLYQFIIIGGTASAIWALSQYTRLMGHPKFTWFTAAMVLLFSMNAGRRYTQWFFSRPAGKGA